ncbi:Germinal-center associated nuclear protein [Morella rubra]|uniref:Germinal-center associated nuclear protein n=1 Tax=Morella rubra TaxID=262757 RepID=A0A6A1WME6_9ROSI|nr:Germinal-center associated nuclear protein [Morella rubra]
MERGRRQRSNPSSSSSTRSGSRKFPSNSTKDAKFPSANHDNPDFVIPTSVAREEEDLSSGDSRSLPALVGTCPFMCPAGERAQRERLRDLAVFERLDGNPGKTSPGLAVKKFCRTISIRHVQASDVRPLPVLEDTLDHLLRLLDSTQHPFHVVHDFIFDRTRSIRQDLSMQRIVNEKALYMYEKMVKFHVMSLHKMRRRSDTNTSSVHYLNMEQLTKALASLLDLYDANRDSDSMYENEAEFRSFYVLLHLGSHSQPTGESLSLWFRHVPAQIIKSKEMCFARRILRFFRIGNYRRFLLATAAEASYLQYCIIEPYINEVRALALSCISSGGYNLQPYPLAHLSKLLMMKESDLVSFCNDCGLQTCTDEEGNYLLPTKQTTFSCPKGGFQSYSFAEAYKRQRGLGLIIINLGTYS